MFVCVSEQTASQPTKRERKPEGCEDVLQDLLWGKAQPDTSKVARNKSCWGLCWVSIVPLALSAPGRKLHSQCADSPPFFWSPNFFREKGKWELNTSTSRNSNVKRQNLTHYWILPSSHSSGAHRNGWVRPSGFNWMLPYIHFQKNPLILKYDFFFLII